MASRQTRWRVYHGRDPEVELRRLNRRLRSVSRRYERAIRLRRVGRWLQRAGVVFAILLIGYGALKIAGPWPPGTTLRHLAAFPGCTFARAVNLAPAMSHEPGYWRSHDRDGDGMACEPRPQR